MKRIGLFLLCVVLVITCVACGTNTRREQKENITLVLSSLELPADGNVMIACFAAGLMDINFDGTPELIAAYPGGSAGNVFLEFYDITAKTKLDAMVAGIVVSINGNNEYVDAI